MKILYRTIMGSRLYGLAREDSDYDWLNIVDGQFKTTQAVNKITGQDETVMSLTSFINEANSGVPRALEAMFSHKAEIDKIAQFRANFRAGSNYNVYLGIMKRIALTEKYDDFKHRRHILRLGLNMKDLRTWGRFNPTLSKIDIEMVNSLAALPMEHVYNDALVIAWS